MPVADCRAPNRMMPRLVVIFGSDIRVSAVPSIFARDLLSAESGQLITHVFAKNAGFGGSSGNMARIH